MLDKVQELVDAEACLGAMLEQLKGQETVLEAQELPFSLRSALDWVGSEVANVEAALYELRQAVQNVERRAKRLQEAGNL